MVEQLGVQGYRSGLQLDSDLFFRMSELGFSCFRFNYKDVFKSGEKLLVRIAKHALYYLERANKLQIGFTRDLGLPAYLRVNC